MKIILKNCVAAIPVLFLFSTASAQFDTNGTLAQPESPLEENFQVGHFEATLGGGPMFSPLGDPKNRAVINYAAGNVQFGSMVTSPGADGFLRGNLELVPEAFGADIFHGPGSYIAGGTLWFRYNFVQPRWRVVPYLQVGGGFTFTDIDHNIVGQDFNFNVDGAAGLRWFIARHWTINLEYRFQHISNADLGPRNLGINAEGPVLGLSWFF